MTSARFKKGQIPWNKSKTGLLTIEQRKRMSESHKGKKLSEEQIKKMSGRIPWNKGISPSEETRKKISESTKGRISPMKGKHPSSESIEKGRLTRLKLVDRHERVEEEIDSGWARLLGYLLSDGYWGKGQTLKFVNNNLSYIEEVKNLAKEKGFFIAERRKNDGIEVHLKVFEKVGQNVTKSRVSEAIWRAYFRNWGLYNRDSLGIILKLPKDIQISFLQGYFNGDGYLWVGKDRGYENRITRIEIGFCIGIHKRLAEDIQKMLSKWGVISIIKSEWMKKSTRPFYRVLISKRESGKKLIYLLYDSKYPPKFAKAKELMEIENAKYSNG